MESALSGGGTYSTGAKYCGVTTTGGTDNQGHFTGNLGGYSGAKTACQTSCASALAHMCTVEELVRSAQLSVGMPGEYLWYSSGSDVPVGSSRIIDCAGWTSTAATFSGPAWLAGPNVDPCSASHSIACCK